ncbi:MAG: lactonase family protein [Acidobacteria bacterium]|nr:lactonase family protein [Acidobacteriota bacterium]
MRSRRLVNFGTALWALAAFSRFGWLSPFAWAGGPGSGISHVYVGTYSPKEGEGIFHATLDTRTGVLGPLRPAAGAKSPAALAIGPGGKFLYATTIVPDEQGKPTGGVAAYAIDGATGALREIDSRRSGGTGPCYLSVDGEGKVLLVSHCGTANVACLPLRADGRFGEAATVIQHEGKSENSEGKPQAHSIIVAPGNRFAIAGDLGLDRLFVYGLDAARGRMAPHQLPFARVPTGAGPRHLAAHPSGRFIYSINELDNTVTALRFFKESGKLEALQSLSALPADFKGESYTADIQAHPGGRLVFGSNRGHDSIAAFRVEPGTGRLQSIGQTPSGGKFPRSIAIHPSGGFLFVANQKSDRLSIFRIDSATGRLDSTGQEIPVPQPVSMRILTRP